ncbi:MAG: TRAP transporter large permease subunit, partial [Pseudomonadota bacterium]|nr:TRAP transporter large permease subunit [Pseudomonadota bacterium]
GRHSGRVAPATAMTRRAHLLAAAASVGILGLLASVFTGRLFAVEAAALGGCLLLAAALATRAFDRAQWSGLLIETLTLSGALFALLVGATTFSLVFRLFGTDRWLAQAVLGSPWTPLVTAALTLLGVAACAWVLDAFEMIFVVVPIVAPLLIAQLGDAQQVAVLLLVVLQVSFLLPPMGYAVLMARAMSGLPRVDMRALLPALSPFIAAQLLVAVAVFTFPAIVHLLDDPAPSASVQPASTEEDIARRMKEMSPQPPEPESAPR